MIIRIPFLSALLAMTLAASNPKVTVTDVDDRTLSTGDGHVTTMVLTTRQEAYKARLVGDRTPLHCLGDPRFRMITVIEFPKSTSRPMRYLLTKLVHSRVNAEAEHLKARYLEKNLTVDPHQDVHVVVDFEGEIARQLGVNDSGAFRVFVFGPDGALRGQWSTVPDAKELDRVLQ